MHNFRFGFAALSVFALLLSVAAVKAAPQSANFAGTWNVTVTGGGQGRGQGQGGAQGGGQGDGQNGGQGGDQAGGGERHGGGGGAQSLTITQDGDKIKVDHKTARGDNAYDATVSGNTISWTEERQNREGTSMKVEYKATLDGDKLTGTMSGGRASRDFTAKRSN